MRVPIGSDLVLNQLPHGADPDNYDWFDIEWADTQVGKSRCRIEPDQLTIFSIMVYPEYERHGFGCATITYFKTRYAAIVADRVRFKARTFWIKLGFVAETEDRYVWHRNPIE